MFVFFDLDRTLLDFDTASELGIKKVFENFRSDIKTEYEEFALQWKKWAQFYFDEYSEGKWTHREQKRMRLWKTFQVTGEIELSFEEADRRFGFYEKTYDENIGPFSDVVPVLESLKKAGVPMGIITNGEEPKQIAKLERFDLKKYFETVVVSSACGVSKPDSGIGKIAAEKIGNPDPKEIWFIGDSLAHDIPLALALGWNGVFINRSGKTYPVPSGIKEIKSLEEILPEILKREN